MRILIVEDDYFQVALMIGELEEAFPGVKTEWIKTELDFNNQIDAIAADPPAAVIVDIMLRWTDPVPNISLPPATEAAEGFYKAGFRCEKKLAERETTKDIPVIL